MSTMETLKNHQIPKIYIDVTLACITSANGKCERTMIKFILTRKDLRKANCKLSLVRAHCGPSLVGLKEKTSENFVKNIIRSQKWCLQW